MTKKVKILSLNVAEPKVVVDGGKEVLTSIFKQPVEGALQVTVDGLMGNQQADLKNHGGEYKAVYAYPFEHYAFWQQHLQRDQWEMGLFGENLTLTGLLEEQVCIGDIYRAGSALLQVTQPRTPCFKLGLRMGDKRFVKQFTQSLRTGFYFRVLEEGELAAGDALDRVGKNSHSVSVRDVFNAQFIEKTDVSVMRRAIEIDALFPGIRELFVKRLARQDGD